MLTLLRDHAQSWIIKVVLSVIILTFVISFGVGQFTASKEVLVKVGSEEILVRDYNKRYQEEMDKLRRQFPDNAEQFALQFNLRRQVYDRMVDRSLLLQAAQREGLVATDQEVSDAVQALDAFHLNGKFDYSTYRSILTQNRLTPESYEDTVRKDLLVGKYRRNLLAGLVVSRDEIEQRYRLENEKVEVDYFAVDPAKFKAQVKSDTEAEQAFYDKNKAQYMESAKFKINAFVLPLKAVEGKASVRDKAIERYFERHKDEEFSTPKQVRARHILKKIASDASEEDKTKAKTLLQELRNRITKGEDFAQLAKKHSDDATKSKGGDLGFFTREEMLPEFSNAAFELKKGDVSSIVSTAFGLHLIQVTEIKSGSVKTFDQVKDQIKSKLLAERAERSLEVEAGRLPKRIKEEGIEAVAKEFGVKVENSGLFDSTGRINGVGAAAAIYNQLRGRKKDDAGVLRRNPVQGHVFYQVVEVKPTSQKTLDQVRAQVAARVIEEKAAQAAVDAAKKAGTTINSLEAFKAFQAKSGSAIKTAKFSAVDRMIPDLGPNKEFQQVAFRATKEKPFGVAVLGNQAHLIRLKNRGLAENKEAEQMKKEIANQLEQQWAQYFFDNQMERIREDITVEVISPEFVATL